MRRVALVVLLAALFGPGRADAQPSVFSVGAAAGPTLIDAGYTLSADAGFSPASRITVLGGVERTHLASRITHIQAPDGRRVVASGFRGGTITAATAALRVTLFPAGRPTPYGIIGIGAGTSRPNVNDTFPIPVTNDARFAMFGGGLQIPVGTHAALVADARLLIGAEGVEGIVAVAPFRAGISWRF